MNYIDNTSGANTSYCSMGVHVRVWGDSPEAAPNTCHCGAMKYVKHRCVCGNEHEQQQQVPNEPYRGEVVTRLIAPNVIR